MNTPEPEPTDEQLGALLAATEKDAAPPDPAALARLREQSLAAFQSAASPSVPLSFWNRLMLPSSLRWVAASAAAVLLLGVGVAYWLGAWNRPVPIDDEKFVISDTVDDGRIGKVTDAQGVVSVKPVMHERWSPVQPRLVLKPGDWLRTDSRGANAVALKLLKATGVIVGPHSTVELVKADELRLLAGEIEITATADAPVELHGPDKQKLVIRDKQHYRVEKEKLVRVEKEPLWLQGFKGTTANESIGSLVATVDGRNVPLTVGYHHVTVDIRDQIARTVIEESFVNRTNAVLEGVFYFPLPQDASISGFGMWIGDQLVEADIVEKQRAREIYETILREKRDPGLLEWTGGNIFKARVYPIPANSEKRIKITYTQVLPLQGNRYRYSYALQSELLKQHPLRDLKIDLKVNSVSPLKSISSPTHATRLAKTEHSGHVEFTAQEYTPTRDFEAVIEVEGRPADVVMIPHRRGDDGYFMVQLTPPGSGGDWERPLVPNGEPLRLLLVADTSASMDAGQRATQNAVIASLLDALTAKDTVNVAACDVNTDWVFEKPVPATPANIATIRDTLGKRASLGWTDLDKAFSSALAMTAPGTHIVYIGDGITTTGSADPVSFAARLRRLYEGKPGTAHAVVVGSSYEPAAIKAIATLGGGSVRRVSGERGPQAVTLELLSEIATPALRDLKVEFTGLRTARVYPEELPNVPAGTQQILLGRYLPQGKEQTGEIVVTGKLGSKPVRYVSKVTLRDAETGNSFIPRLWARMHLDKLLEQGGSEVVKQDIIALSEEFNIMTPYTSLLVLETDADRARFAVKRRFQMRDGERFFAEGRDNATYELKQQHMRRAGDYRTALRRSIIAQLATVGRDPRLFQRRQEAVYARLRGTAAAPFYSERNKARIVHGLDAGWDYDGEGDEFDSLALGDFDMKEFKGEMRSRGRFKDSLLNEDREYFSSSGGEFDKRKRLFDETAPESSTPLGRQISLDDPIGETLGGLRMDKTEADGLGIDLPEPGYASFDRMEDSLKQLSDFGIDDYRGTKLNAERGGRFGRSRGPRLVWLNTLFPALVPARVDRPEPKTQWPDAAVALSKSLLRKDQLAKLKGGVVITRQSDTFDAARNELTGRGKRLELVSPTAWLERSAHEGGEVLVSWCDAKDCGVYSTAFQLGRLRASAKLDLQEPPLGLIDGSVSPLHLMYLRHTATIEAIAKDRVLLILKDKTYTAYETRYLVDTARHVLLSIESRTNGKVAATTKFDDFVEVAGSWWARRVETLDEKGQRQALATQTVTEVSADDFTKRMTAELAGKDKVLFLKQPLPKVSEAKAAVAAGKATFDDRAVLTMYFAATQQWSRSLEHFQECERLAGNKPGARWLRDSFLFASRKHEELRKRLLAEGAALATATDAESLANDHFLAAYLFGQANYVLEANELITLGDALKKVADRQPAHLQAVKAWQVQRVRHLQQAGRSDEALSLMKALAVDYPREYMQQYNYAQALAGAGDYPAAYAWITRVLVPEAKWDDSAESSLRGLYASFLEQQGRVRDLAAYLADWIKRDPKSEQPYSQYLAALIRSDQAAQAEALVTQWLREGRVEGEVPPAVRARLDTAVAFALGRVHNFNTSRLDEQWHKPLAELVLFCATHEHLFDVASTIVQNGRFRSTDAGRAAIKALGAELLKGVVALPTKHLNRLVDWAWSDSGLETADWEKVAATLRKRWDAEMKPEVKHELGSLLVRVLHRFTGDSDLQFLRVQWKTGPEAYRTQYANHLFNMLIVQSWKAEIEDEAFALLDKLSDAEHAAARLQSRITTLHTLTDAMIERRYDARRSKLEHPEKLSRVDLRKKEDEFRKLAREGFADRLRTEAAKQPKPFAHWLTAERLWLDVLLERDFNQVAAACWEILATPVAKANPDDDNAVLEQFLTESLRDRVLATLSHLAARKGADPGLIDRLVKFIDQQIKDHPESARWRAEKYQLLITLDRVKELEAELGQWIAKPDAENRWRRALARLLAEQGRVAEAIKLFEAVEAADELIPTEYRDLADWYMVENRRAEHERATTAVYATAEEYRLGQRVQAYLHPWQRTDGHLPTQLDKEVLRLFKVLFEKSAAPQNYLVYLQQFYAASRAPELLSMLPDGVVGHTAGTVYPFLGGMQSVLREVRDEATADELVKRIDAVRKAAKTATDQRALDLLDLMVERRAADLQNQPGPHADRALAALTRAAKGTWSAGEPRLMADFLSNLDKIAHPALAKEQVRLMESLHREAAVGSSDRLHIAYRYAVVLGAYSRGADAMDLLTAALKEAEEANGGKLPTSAHGALSLLINYTEDAGQYARGEKLILAQLTHPIHDEQKNWLTMRLDEVYLRALQTDNEVSLGKRAELYKAIERRLYVDVKATDQNHRYALLNQFNRLYGLGHSLKFAGAEADFKEYAFKRLPPILKEQTTHYDYLVRDTADTVRSILGPRDAIAFLLDRIGDEPAWFRYTDRNAWTQYSTRLGDWRAAAKDLGDLEPRLLKYVLDELRRDLRSREHNTRTMCDRQRDYYWEAKAGDFAKVADEVLAERKQSSASVEYIASYLFWGLSQKKRAIEVLFAAHAQKVLAESGQSQLIDYLHYEARYAESIPLLLPLVDTRPHNLGYRTRLMHAYYRTQKQAELLALLKDTDTYFHQEERWNESVLAGLAYSCLENHLYAQSAAYYEELIPMHQRSDPRRGIGNGTLSNYYAHAAKAYAGLGNTKKAVDMASGAVVSWGSALEQRKYALEALVKVLVEAPDLAGFVAELDKEKLQSAVVRKAIGQAWVRKNEHARAIPQLQLAAELQPNDTETYQLLVTCYDKIGDKDGAVKQLLQAVELSRRDLKLYEQLGQRFAESNQPVQAERAFTSMVEMLANESEGHAALAEVREKQNRWPEAIAHWQRVAEIRALEPTGLVKLAGAQIHERQWDAAATSLRKLRNQNWPDRFRDLPQQLRDLEKKLAEKK